MFRWIVLLFAASAVLAGCAASSPSSSDSLYRCDRNGEREQRVVC